MLWLLLGQDFKNLGNFLKRGQFFKTRATFLFQHLVTLLFGSVVAHPELLMILILVPNVGAVQRLNPGNAKDGFEESDDAEAERLSGGSKS